MSVDFQHLKVLDSERAVDVLHLRCKIGRSPLLAPGRQNADSG